MGGEIEVWTKYCGVIKTKSLILIGDKESRKDVPEAASDLGTVTVSLICLTLYISQNDFL